MRHQRIFFYFLFYNAAAGFKSCLTANRGIGSRDQDADKIAQPPPTIYKVPLARYPLLSSSSLGVTLVCSYVKTSSCKKKEEEKEGKRGIAVGTRKNLKAKSRVLPKTFDLALLIFPQILISPSNSIKWILRCKAATTYFASFVPSQRTESFSKIK